jgi:cell volume regulation protein A
MAIGSDGTGWIEFDDYELARTVGIVALALILFEGGLTAGWGEIRPQLGLSLSLATAGTMLTAAIAGLAANMLFDFTLLESLLVGAVVSATDGAAIFALLRESTLRKPIARTLEGESGFNDPMAVLLVLGLIDWIQEPGYGVLDMGLLLIQQLGIGTVAGLAVGWLGQFVLRNARLASGGLYPVATLATAALAFGSADVLHGSGFLAVYLAGLTLGGAAIPAQQTIMSFHQGLAWVAQLTMFLTLGLLVFPSQLADFALEGTVLALVLMFVARPLATAVATFGFGFSLAERTVIGWAGLRGAVPMVLATFPIIAAVPHSTDLFNIVFFAVLLSTIVQGSTFESLARRIGVTTDEPALPRPLAEAGTIRRLGAEVLEFPVGPGDSVIGARVRDLGLPREAVVNVIVREGQAIPPRGSTIIHLGDRIHVLYREESARDLADLTVSWRSGQVGLPQRPRPPRRSSSPVFSVRPWKSEDGDPTRPTHVAGFEVIQQLRIRRDTPGALLVLEDGRYAIAGPLLAIGSRSALMRWAERRMKGTSDEERAWMRTAVGALASDAHERSRDM